MGRAGIGLDPLARLRTAGGPRIAGAAVVLMYDVRFVVVG
jgi:hypothetical protein